MKRIALLAAAAATLAATPAMAGGHLGLLYTNTSADDFGGDDIDGWQGEGAIGFGAGSWGGQFDASLGNLSVGGEDADTWAAAGHFWYNGGTWRLGAVYAASDIDGITSIGDTSYGIEGTLDIGANFVANASATWGTADFLADLDTNMFDFGGDFYASPNVRIGADFGFGNAEVSSFEADLQSLGVDAEFQPWAAPVSLTISYDSYEFDGGGPFDFSTDTWSVGARWNFGGGTLRDRDNTTPFDGRTAIWQRVYGVQ